MEPCYQLLDVAARTLKMAMETGGFYKSPAVLAAVRHYEAELMRIIAAYSESGSSKSQSLEAPVTAHPPGGIMEEGDLEDEDPGDPEQDSDVI